MNRKLFSSLSLLQTIWISRAFLTLLAQKLHQWLKERHLSRSDKPLTFARTLPRKRRSKLLTKTSGAKVSYPCICEFANFDTDNTLFFFTHSIFHLSNISTYFPRSLLYSLYFSFNRVINEMPFISGDRERTRRSTLSITDLSFIWSCMIIYILNDPCKEPR